MIAPSKLLKSYHAFSGCLGGLYSYNSGCCDNLSHRLLTVVWHRSGQGVGARLLLMRYCVCCDERRKQVHVLLYRWIVMFHLRKFPPSKFVNKYIEIKQTLQLQILCCMEVTHNIDPMYVVLVFHLQNIYFVNFPHHILLYILTCVCLTDTHKVMLMLLCV